jgi:hypothetical protein
MSIQKFKRNVVAPNFKGGVTVTAADVPATAVSQYRFVQNGNTGTGASQSIAHGLGVVPSSVIVSFEGSTAEQTFTLGTSTSTNVVLTVTSGAKFTVAAFV